MKIYENDLPHKTKPKQARKKKASYKPTPEEAKMLKSLKDMVKLREEKKIEQEEPNPYAFPEKYKIPKRPAPPSTQAVFFRRLFEAYGKAYEDEVKVIKIDVNGVPIVETIEVQGQKVQILKGYRFGTATRSVSDLQVWGQGGRMCHVELKGRGDIERKGQKELREWAQKAGHVWFVFKNVEQLRGIHKYITNHDN